MEQMYVGGFTSGKIIKPIKMNSTETVISSTERIISPLEAKTVMGGISQGEKYSIEREKWVIGSYDSAPRMYGSPIQIGGYIYAEEKTMGIRCDPDFKVDRPVKKTWWQFCSSPNTCYGGEDHIITPEERYMAGKGLLR